MDRPLPYQSRVKVEQRELEEKLVALLEFQRTKKFDELTLAERCRLFRQCDAMDDYNNILKERIEEFK